MPDVAIVGKKLGMTRVFDEDGAAIPVTVIEAAPNTITGIRKADRDGYDAVQLAGDPTDERKLSQGRAGPPEEGRRRLPRARSSSSATPSSQPPAEAKEGEGSKEDEAPAAEGEDASVAGSARWATR